MKPPRTMSIRGFRLTELEVDFQDQVIHELVLTGWLIYHIPDSRRATMPGFPDLFCFHFEHGRVVALEMKRENGTVSREQKQVGVCLRAAGVPWYVVRPSTWPAIKAEIDALLSE
ncbi:MAG: VRR-NUC domain-containing protein [Chloroflexota bacterium]|nr:VRR-NUC domain-containing protein [Chloroflexota bacterium]